MSPSESKPFQTVDDLCHQAFYVAENAGWHDRPTGYVDRVLANLALVHSEVSEALETYRRNGNKTWTEVDGKPEGWGAELADILIRVCELFAMTCEESFDQIIAQKMAYNQRRNDVPAKSGGKSI